MSRLPEDRWCPISVDTLPTGDGVGCGRYATERRTTPADEALDLCPGHAAEVDNYGWAIPDTGAP